MSENVNYVKKFSFVKAKIKPRIESLMRLYCK